MTIGYGPHWTATAMVAAMRKLADWRLAAEWPALALLAAAVIVAALTYLGPVNQAIQCDGAVPKSFVPAGYNGSGCVLVPADWFEGTSADKYADETWVCLGMCLRAPSIYWDSQTGTWVDTAP